MPSIYYMNAPSHPFWDFVQDMNAHGAAWGVPPPPPLQHDNEAPHAVPEQPQERNAAEPTAEDPPEVDPSTVRPDSRELPFRGRHGHCGGPGRRGPGGDCGRGFGPRGGPWSHWSPWGPPPPFGPGEHPAGPRGRHSPSPPGAEPHGRGGHHHLGGPGHRHHGPPHELPGRRGPWGRRGRHGPPPPPPFNLRQFIANLGERIGMDLEGVAEGMGLEKLMGAENATNQIHFEPRADIFERPEEFAIHVSLPGGKKEDVGVDWDGEQSHLHIAGVVHRPGVDETMLEQLVVDGRKKEVGVFEKIIKLGTRRDPANIDVAGIKAKMADGILVIQVPKVEIEPQKRDVPINSQTPSPQRATRPTDPHPEIVMYDAGTETVRGTPQPEQNTKGKAKEAEYQQKKQANISASILDEPLPVYRVEHQEAKASHRDHMEHDGSDDEGEYVKINVD